MERNQTQNHHTRVLRKASTFQLKYPPKPNANVTQNAPSQYTPHFSHRLVVVVSATATATVTASYLIIRRSPDFYRLIKFVTGPTSIQVETFTNSIN